MVCRTGQSDAAPADSCCRRAGAHRCRLLLSLLLQATAHLGRQHRHLLLAHVSAVCVCGRGCSWETCRGCAAVCACLRVPIHFAATCIGRLHQSLHSAAASIGAADASSQRDCLEMSILMLALLAQVGDRLLGANVPPHSASTARIAAACGGPKPLHRCISLPLPRSTLPRSTLPVPGCSFVPSCRP